MRVRRVINVDRGLADRRIQQHIRTIQRLSEHAEACTLRHDLRHHVQAHRAAQLRVVNVLRVVAGPGQAALLGLRQAVEGGADRAHEVQLLISHTFGAYTAGVLADRPHDRIERAHGRISVNDAAVVTQTHGQLAVLQGRLNVQVTVRNLGAAVNLAGHALVTRGSGGGRLRRRCRASRSRGARGRVCGRGARRCRSGGRRSRHARLCGGGRHRRHGRNLAGGHRRNVAGLSGRSLGGSLARLSRRLGRGRDGGLSARRRIHRSRLRRIANGCAIGSQCAVCGVLGARLVVRRNLSGGGGSVHIRVGQHLHAQSRALVERLVTEGKARHTILNGAFQVEVRVDRVILGVEAAAHEAAHLRVLEADLNGAEAVAVRGDGHVVVHAGRRVLLGAEYGVRRIRDFLGPGAVTVIAVHALSLAGLVGELVGNPAGRLRTIRIGGVGGEDRLQLGALATEHFRPGGGTVHDRQVSQEVAVVVQGQGALEVLVRGGEGDVAELIVSVLVLSRVGVQAVRRHGQHVLCGVQVTDGCRVVAVDRGHGGGGSVTERRLHATNLPDQLRRLGADDAAVGGARHGAVGDHVAAGAGEGRGVVGVATLVEQPGVPAGRAAGEHAVHVGGGIIRVVAEELHAAGALNGKDVGGKHAVTETLGGYLSGGAQASPDGVLVAGGQVRCHVEGLAGFAEERQGGRVAQGHGVLRLAVAATVALADPVDGLVQFVGVCAGLVGVRLVHEDEGAVLLIPVCLGGVNVALGGDDFAVVGARSGRQGGGSAGEREQCCGGEERGGAAEGGLAARDEECGGVCGDPSLGLLLRAHDNLSHFSTS